MIGSIFTLLFIFSCTPPPSALDRLKTGGELRVLIRNVPTIYYQGPFGPSGFEYELLQKFAAHLKVKLTLIFAHDTPEILERLDS